MMIDIDMVTTEFWAMMNRMNATLEPRHFAMAFTRRLRTAFQEQIDESFANEKSPGGDAWAPLSEWRIDARGGSEHPILQWTGDLHGEAKSFKGRIRLVPTGFSFWFPDFGEMSGKYWGLTAGQMINPLGVTPLAMFPRRILGGNTRNEKDSVEALVRYFRAEGWEVVVE